jgi:hypothetical protein
MSNNDDNNWSGTTAARRHNARGEAATPTPVVGVDGTPRTTKGVSQQPSARTTKGAAASSPSSSSRFAVAAAGRRLDLLRILLSIACLATGMGLVVFGGSKMMGEVVVGRTAQRLPAAADVRRTADDDDNDDYDIPGLSSVPIYLHDPSSGGSSSPWSIISYRSLASIWDRNTTYEDVLRHAAGDATHRGIDDLPHRLLLQSGTGDRNVTAIFHASPKMASSTLRKACVDAQQTTCGHVLGAPPVGRRMPEGYRTPVRLTQLFGTCPGTRHFCILGGIPLTGAYARHYGNRTFLHLFPFRTYDEWARSALHQSSYRGGEAECRDTEALLDGGCTPHRYELDFGRYTKSNLASFARSYARLATTGDAEGGGAGARDRHLVLLHDYKRIDETLASLSSGDDGDGVPRLPGTERRINSVNDSLESGMPRVRQGPCADEGRILEKFHRCFSDALGPLY